EPKQSAASAEAKGDPPAEKEAAGESAAAPAKEAYPPASPPRPAPSAPAGAAWASPLALFEQRWTWLESRLLTFVLVWQILALVAWVCLNGLSQPISKPAGGVFRAIVLSVSLGLAIWFRGRNKAELTRRDHTLYAIGASIVTVLICGVLVWALEDPVLVTPK